MKVGTYIAAKPAMTNNHDGESLKRDKLVPLGVGVSTCIGSLVLGYETNVVGWDDGKQPADPTDVRDNHQDLNRPLCRPIIHDQAKQLTKCDSPERIRIDVAVQPCAEYYVTVAVK
ncbi:hypothetical protein [Methyloversatilis sp.]|uniref:hypothetical protein n=1 Tax=Methyloversatilis sp. TaxID=2569862 RepID=UPI0027BA764D|nr:hypothetical protein [Methyloversatilis sp.]